MQQRVSHDHNPAFNFGPRGEAHFREDIVENARRCRARRSRRSQRSPTRPWRTKSTRRFRATCKNSRIDTTFEKSTRTSASASSNSTRPLKVTTLEKSSVCHGAAGDVDVVMDGRRPWSLYSPHVCHFVAGCKSPGLHVVDVIPGVIPGHVHKLLWYLGIRPGVRRFIAS